MFVEFLKQIIVFNETFKKETLWKIILGSKLVVIMHKPEAAEVSGV